MEGPVTRLSVYNQNSYSRYLGAVVAPATLRQYAYTVVPTKSDSDVMFCLQLLILTHLAYRANGNEL